MIVVLHVLLLVVVISAVRGPAADTTTAVSATITTTTRRPPPQFAYNAKYSFNSGHNKSGPASPRQPKYKPQQHFNRPILLAANSNPIGGADITSSASGAAAAAVATAVDKLHFVEPHQRQPSEFLKGKSKNYKKIGLISQLYFGQTEASSPPQYRNISARDAFI